MKLLRARHSWPESAGFELHRLDSEDEYIFLHFLTPVELYYQQQWRTVNPGALIIFRPDTPQHFISRKPLLHDWMHLGGNVEEEFARFGLQTDTLYQMVKSDPITQQIARLEGELLSRSSHWEIYTQALLQEIWVTIVRQSKGEHTAPVVRETADLLRSLRADMILHPEWPWTHEMMATQINISCSRLYVLYRRQFATSPGKDLISIRIERAKSMLEQGASVANCADALGYANVSHFIRQFKLETGVTPGSWMQKKETT